MQEIYEALVGLCPNFTLPGPWHSIACDPAFFCLPQDNATILLEFQRQFADVDLITAGIATIDAENSLMWHPNLVVDGAPIWAIRIKPDQKPATLIQMQAFRLSGRTEIHVAADIQCFGTEVRAADDPERKLVMTPPAELGLSINLVYNIRSWQRWFDGVVDLCGLEARYEFLGDKFDEIGRQLAERIARELGPKVRITYGPQGGWCRQMGKGQIVVVQE